MVYYRILNIVLCYTYDLVFFSPFDRSLHVLTPIYHSILPSTSSPLETSLFSMSIIFCFTNRFVSQSLQMISCDICLSLTYFTQYNNLIASMFLQMALFHSFMAEQYSIHIHTYTYTHTHTHTHTHTPKSIHLSVDIQVVSMYWPLWCYGHWGTCVFLNYSFVQVYAQEWDCWIIW